MPVWISRLIVLIDWLLALVVDDLYADLDRAKAEAEGRETARRAEEARLVEVEKRAQADIERARADAESARKVEPTPAGEESAAAAEFDRLMGD